jgi:hypothetical protein
MRPNKLIISGLRTGFGVMVEIQMHDSVIKIAPWWENIYKAIYNHPVSQEPKREVEWLLSWI